MEPQIVAAGSERLSFALDLSHPAELRLRVEPAAQATVELAIVERGVRRVLERRALSAPADIALPLPSTSRLLELTNVGDVVWSDPRVTEEAPRAWRIAGVLALLALAWRRIQCHPLRLPHATWARTALLGGLTATVSAGLGLVVLEVGLRTARDRLPSWITDARRDLGEVPPDPRWQASPLYGQRLSAHLDTYCEWQEGDIVRMGYLPPGLARHPAYRFPFVTDALGFRNSEAEETPTIVAALGDSFTDGMTLPVELTWPARLSSLLGVRVRNYGTAGFGPGQELLVLKEHVRARRPRRVVVGFFAGNDLVDAERFESFRNEHGPLPVLREGWKLKPAITRFDRLYLTSLYQGAVGAVGSWRERSRHPVVVWPSGSRDDYSGEDPSVPRAPSAAFNRGLFTVPVAGHVLQFAFLAPYLNRLTLSRHQLETSSGWELTRLAYREMQRTVRADGGELVVMFIPSKDQVYLPLLVDSFARPELQGALDLCLGHPPAPPDPELLMRNRLALNDLMREFCAQEGITFLDLTEDLESTLRRGQNVYFPDDSHWNAKGHETAAVAVTRLLRAEGF